MTLQTQGAQAFAPLGTAGWLWDDVACEYVPVNGNVPADLTRGIGRLTASPVGTANTGPFTAFPARATVNQLLPVGVAFTSGTAGPESNTFTTRQAVTPAALTQLFNAGSFGVASVANQLPAGALNLLGRKFRISGGGTWGVTATPNFTFDLAIGAVVIATTQACALTAVASPQNFQFSVDCQVQTAGASGAIFSSGTFLGQITTITSFPLALTNSTPGTLATVDLTAVGLISANVTWSVSNAANRIRLFDLSLEVLG